MGALGCPLTAGSVLVWAMGHRVRWCAVSVGVDCQVPLRWCSPTFLVAWHTERWCHLPLGRRLRAYLDCQSWDRFSQVQAEAHSTELTCQAGQEVEN